MRFNVADNLVAAVQAAETIALTNATTVYVMRNGDEYAISYDYHEAGTRHIAINGGGKIWDVDFPRSIPWSPENGVTELPKAGEEKPQPTPVEGIAIYITGEAKYVAEISYANGSSLTTIAAPTIREIMGIVSDELKQAGH